MDKLIGLKHTISLWEKCLHVQCDGWNLALRTIGDVHDSHIMIEILCEIAQEEIEKLAMYACAKHVEKFNTTWRPGLPV